MGMSRRTYQISEKIAFSYRNNWGFPTLKKEARMRKSWLSRKVGAFLTSLPFILRLKPTAFWKERL
jgi:hypothetical protein